MSDVDVGRLKIEKVRDGKLFGHWRQKHQEFLQLIAVYVHHSHSPAYARFLKCHVRGVPSVT